MDRNDKIRCVLSMDYMLSFAIAPRQVMAIYEKHNKEKLHTVDEVLDKYEGKWGIMLQVLSN